MITVYKLGKLASMQLAYNSALAGFYTIAIGTKNPIFQAISYYERCRIRSRLLWQMSLMVLVLAAALVFCWRGIEQELGQDMNLFLCIALIPFVGLLAWSCRIFFISVPNECSSIAYAVGVLMAREEISESTFELLSESDIRFHITKLLEQSAATWYASRKGADPEKGIDSSDFRILHHIFENAGLLYERFPSYKEKMQAKFWEA